MSTSPAQVWLILLVSAVALIARANRRHLWFSLHAKLNCLGLNLWLRSRIEPLCFQAELKHVEQVQWAALKSKVAVCSEVYAHAWSSLMYLDGWMDELCTHSNLDGGSGDTLFSKNNLKYEKAKRRKTLHAASVVSSKRLQDQLD